MANPSTPETEAAAGTDAVLPVVEEALVVSKHQVDTGKVRVRTHVDTVEEVAKADLRSDRFEVTRVPVDRYVDAAPQVRTEGNTTIVPVLEEVLVVQKRLVLKEEIHIRHLVETESVERPIALRRERAVVERFDADGRLRPDEEQADEP